MPRIDPQQLLVCLTPLLAPNGGIKSSAEVIRLANLMEKYSKKLVSKSIYIQILKCTETELLGQFMAGGGWNLVHNWLRDGSDTSNWPFVQEILEMLLLCPVDGNRLKSNHTPKIVKNLSLNCSQNHVRILSSRLVEQWLRIAHQEKQLLQNNGLNGTVNITNNNTMLNVDEKKLPENDSSVLNNEIESIKTEKNNVINGIETKVNNEDTVKKSSENVKYKISNKESGLVLSIKRSTSPNVEEQSAIKIKSPDVKEKSEHKSRSSSSEKDKEKSKKSSSSSSSHRSSSSSKSSHRDKERSSHKSGSSSSSSSSKSSDKHRDSSRSSKHTSSSSTRDKDKHRDKKDSKKDVEKEQAEKDKETLSFLQPLPSAKLQRIPKRSHSDSKLLEEPSSKVPKTAESIEKKKPSISIEVRKGDKPKTVKTLNSQFRNHGLAEEPPPPPSRKALKKPTTTTATPVVAPLISSPISSAKASHSPPPIKKLQLEKALEPDVPERQGGVKLIKPKPMLVESTGFLDALDASAVLSKKDPKKRKRLSSGSSSSGKKDEPESPKIDVKPLKFYNDTLEENAEEEAKPNGESSPKENDVSDKKTENNKEEEKNANTDSLAEKVDVAIKEEETSEPEEKRPPGAGTGPDGPPCVLVDPTRPRKKKRPIRWKNDEELTDVRYFELDENERVNVTKTFTEQKQMEHVNERTAFLQSRSFKCEDTMCEQTTWRPLVLVDDVPKFAYGSKSREAEIQTEREKNTLQNLYFGPSKCDSLLEAETEEVEHLEPTIIPLDDVTGNPDSVNYINAAWPTPKGDQPQFLSNAFGNLFTNLGSPITIPAAPVISSTALNPLASLNLGGLQSAIAPRDSTAGINLLGMIPTTPFMQPPPTMMIQNNYQSSGNSYSSRNSNSNSSSNNNNNRNRGGGSSGSNWVRGNSTFRRGTCHQYQRTGFCRTRNSGCPYIHER